jgi:hypothetical protein
MANDRNDRNNVPTRPNSGPPTPDAAPGAGTAVSTTVAPPQKRRTLEDRLRNVTAQSSLKPGDHLEDLVLYRNATKIPQSLTNLQGKQVTLLARGIYTDKSVREYDRNPDATLEKFEGGTIILTRATGIPLVAAGIVEELEVVDKADPDDFGQTA